MATNLLLDEGELVALGDLVTRRGDVGAAADLDVSRTTVLRALASLPVRHGSALAIRTGLAKAVPR